VCSFTVTVLWSVVSSVPFVGFGESAEQAELANKLMYSGGNPLLS